MSLRPLFALLLLLPGCKAPSPSFVTLRFQAMSTVVTLQAPGTLPPEEERQIQAILDDVDQRANEWRPDSPIGRINSAQGAPQTLDPDLLALLQESLDLARRTDGAFDPTWAALWPLWDFRAEHPHPPKDEAVQAALAHVGYTKLHLQGAEVRLDDPQAQIGLGAITKGWALDRLAQALLERGTTDFLLSAGGQLLAHGSHGDRPWQVGIRDPRGGSEDYFVRLPLLNRSMSTSGDYERFFEFEGRRYHHILDPRTGHPARGLRSATVLAPTGSQADALSTAVFVLGLEQGMRLVRSIEGVEALLVTDDGEVHSSPGMKSLQIEVHPPRSGG